MNEKNYILIRFFYLFISITLILYFLYSGIVHDYYVPFFESSVNKFSDIDFFGDFQYILKIIHCHNLGFDVYQDNKCVQAYDIKYGSFAYGPILLYIPEINENFKNEFIIIFSSLIIAVYIYSIISLFKPQKFFQFIILTVLIFNPISFLLVERLNSDIIIFIFLTYIILLKNNYFLKSFIIILLSIVKFYPAIFIIYFLFAENLNFRKKIIFFISNFLILLISFYLMTNELQSIFEIMHNIARSFKFAFSLNSFTLIMNYFLNFKNLVVLKIFIICIFIILSLFLNYFFIKKNLEKIKILTNKTDFKIFLLASLLLMILYILFSNNYYREVYIIAIIPYLYRLAYDEKILFPKVIIYFILAKYLLMLVFGPYYIFSDLDSGGLLYKLCIATKILMDFILMSMILSTIIAILTQILKNIYLKFN